jgi:hypothetical protein
MTIDFESFRLGYIFGLGAPEPNKGELRNAYEMACAIVAKDDTSEPAADAEGWIKHDGRFCPCHDGMLVDVKFGDGEVKTGGRASEWGWGWVRESGASDDDIDFWRPAR